MNGIGNERYGSGWEKLSKRLRLIYPCAICGENSLEIKECHHIDRDKRNSNPSNAIVLCRECHTGVHNGTHNLPDPLPKYINASVGEVKVSVSASIRKDWFDPSQPIKIIPGLRPEIAMKFRRDNIKRYRDWETDRKSVV